MKINGHDILDIKLIFDSRGYLLDATQFCQNCKGRGAKVLYGLVMKDWKKVYLCKPCIIKTEMFLSLDDLNEYVLELSESAGKQYG